MIVSMLCMLMLALCSYEDLRRKKISCNYPVVIAGVILFLQVVVFQQGIRKLFSGVVIGLIILIIGVVSKGRIGLGDGILVCITGLTLDFWGNLNMVYYALILAAIVSLLLMFLKRLSRKQSIPFVPFLFLSYGYCFLTDL